MIAALFWLAQTVVQLFVYAVIGMVAISWLSALGIINGRNQIVYTVEDFLTRVTDPILQPIRRFLPHMGNVDLSPLVAILLLQALQILLSRLEFSLVFPVS